MCAPSIKRGCSFFRVSRDPQHVTTTRRCLKVLHHPTLLAAPSHERRGRRRQGTQRRPRRALHVANSFFRRQGMARLAWTVDGSGTNPHRRNSHPTKHPLEVYDGVLMGKARSKTARFEAETETEACPLKRKVRRGKWHDHGTEVG